MHPGVDSAPTWKKSSRSGQNGTCVETARLADRVGVRDSKNAATVLRFTPTEWRTFLSAARAGRFDLL